MYKTATDAVITHSCQRWLNDMSFDDMSSLQPTLQHRFYDYHQQQQQQQQLYAESLQRKNEQQMLARQFGSTYIPHPADTFPYDRLASELPQFEPSKHHDGGMYQHLQQLGVDQLQQLQLDDRGGQQRRDAGNIPRELLGDQQRQLGELEQQRQQLQSCDQLQRQQQQCQLGELQQRLGDNQQLQQRFKFQQGPHNDLQQGLVQQQFRDHYQQQQQHQHSGNYQQEQQKEHRRQLELQDSQQRQLDEQQIHHNWQPSGGEQQPQGGKNVLTEQSYNSQEVQQQGPRIWQPLSFQSLWSQPQNTSQTSEQEASVQGAAQQAQRVSTPSSSHSEQVTIPAVSCSYTTPSGESSQRPVLHSSPKLNRTPPLIQRRISPFERPSQHERLLPSLLADVEGVACPPDDPVSSQPAGDEEDKSSSATAATRPGAAAPNGGLLFTFAPLLPPCRVCGSRASGFHYGANTCEACKGFFRRSLRKKEKYTCVGRGHCEVVNSKGSLCGACRYRKCLSIGMSKQAIKTGRYTHAKKTKDTEEVKRLQLRLQPAVGEEGGSGGTGEWRGASKPLTDEELEKILKRITAAHLQHYSQSQPNERPSEKEKEFVEQKSLREQVFGTLRPIPTDEYMKIYEITGIDVDGRKDLLQEFVPYVECGVRRFIAFAKSIPGFTDLPVEDQIGIIKASRFEAWMVLSHRMFNRELRLYTTAFGQVVSQEEMLKVYDAEYIDIVFATHQRISGLSLQHDEMCLLGAFTMMFTDRCTLTDPARVEKTQDLLLQCLCYLFRKNHAEDKLRLSKVIDILVQLRCVRYLQSQAEEKIALQWSDKINIPALLYEMWLS